MPAWEGLSVGVVVNLESGRARVAGRPDSR